MWDCVGHYSRKLHRITSAALSPTAITLASGVLLGALIMAPQGHAQAPVSSPAAPPARSSPTAATGTLPQGQSFPSPSPLLMMQLGTGPQAQLKFEFAIASNTPVKELLPVRPDAKNAKGPATGRNLAEVPEVDFQAPPPKDPSPLEAVRRTAHTVAKVNHLNAKNRDGFLEALRRARPDLVGLPLTMGDHCRLTAARANELAAAAEAVRACLLATSQPPRHDFWQLYARNCAREAENAKNRWALASFLNEVSTTKPLGPPPEDAAQKETVTLARLAALMQVLAPEPVSVRLGLVKYLVEISHPEAARALARLAVFSEECEVRQAAVVALKERRATDYTDTLLGSLRYPWPPVAERGAEALVKLGRADLVPKLVDLLAAPDPRAPVTTEDDPPTYRVRELVRINHHRNCLLCHAPGDGGSAEQGRVTAGIPIPEFPLSPGPSTGYQRAPSLPAVRFDVTYLRQDFSVFQPVANAQPWPEMQRYDFLVRTREVTELEAVAYKNQLAPAEPGQLSPYQRATVKALRELTGHDAPPTVDAWRRVLERPQQARQAALAR